MVMSKRSKTHRATPKKRLLKKDAPKTSRLKSLKSLKSSKSPKNPLRRLLKHQHSPKAAPAEQTGEIIEPLTGSSVFIEPKPAKPEPKKLPKKPTPLERFDQRPKEDHHKIIISLSVLNLMIFSAIILVLFSKTAHANYADAYHLAKELKKEVELIKSDTSCSRVTDYAHKSFVAAETYDTYIKDCQTISTTPNDYISKLAQTEAVKTDETVSQRFKAFTDAYDSAVTGSKSLALTLDQYRIWHQWVISSSANTSELSWTDAELESTAKILTESDIPTFAKYGQEWQKYFGNFVTASREYYTASFSDEHKEELRTKMTDAKKAYEDWQSSSTPDLKTLLPLENPNIANLSSKYQSFYTVLREAYQQNYDPEVGGCREFADRIICD